MRISKCRTFTDNDYWKSVQYRQFLLYIGQVVMKGVLPMEHYKVFLPCSVCSNILYIKKWCKHYVDYVQHHT